MTKSTSAEHKSFPVGDLIEHILRVVPTIVPTVNAKGMLLDGEDVRAVWAQYEAKDNGSIKATYCDKGRCLYCFVYADEEKKTPTHILRFLVGRVPGEGVIQFVRMFMLTVKNDLNALLPLTHNWEQVWRALRSTQLQRAIAHCVSFDAHICDDWLSMMDSSAHMTYEGVPSQVMAIVIRKPVEFKKMAGDAFLPLSKPISFTQALFGEKWVRSFVDGERVALVLRKQQRGLVVGFLLIEELQESENLEEMSFFPHRSLRLLSQNMGAGDMVMVNARNGDTYVMAAKKEVFWRKHQGRWTVVDPHVLHAALVAEQVADSTAVAVVRVCLDLSFERRGALLCVVSDASDIGVSKMVSDHRSPERTNGPLREALAGKSIVDRRQRQLVSAAAGTDGATVLNKEGEVIDITCMIADVSSDELEMRGIKQSSFPGARTRAAWNSSIFGISIKVSDDGPITVWSQGKLICSIG